MLVVSLSMGVVSRELFFNGDACPKVTSVLAQVSLIQHSQQRQRQIIRCNVQLSRNITLKVMHVIMNEEGLKTVRTHAHSDLSARSLFHSFHVKGEFNVDVFVTQRVYFTKDTSIVIFIKMVCCS